LNSIIPSIRKLSDLPSRCPLAEESEELEADVFHIRHWARKPLAADELQPLMGEAGEGM
jgi:hypothetical protein